MLKYIIGLTIIFNVNWAFAQTDPVQLLQSIFQSENQPLKTDLDEIDLSLSAAATMRALGEKGYIVGVDENGTLNSISFSELEKLNFNLPGVLVIFEEDESSLKASVRLYLNATEEGKPVPEAANVYIFIYGNKLNGKIYIKKVETDFRGLS